MCLCVTAGHTAAYGMPPGLHIKCTLIELILSSMLGLASLGLARLCRKLLIGFNSVDRLASTALNSLIETPCSNKCDKAPQQQQQMQQKKKQKQKKRKETNNVPRWMTMQPLYDATQLKVVASGTTMPKQLQQQQQGGNRALTTATPVAASN